MAGVEKERREKKAYLTKRILVRTSRNAGRQASQDAMRLMGYVVVAQNGWVVRKFADGHIEAIAPIAQAQTPSVLLD